MFTFKVFFCYFTKNEQLMAKFHRSLQSQMVKRLNPSRLDIEIIKNLQLDQYRAKRYFKRNGRKVPGVQWIYVGYSKFNVSLNMSKKEVEQLSSLFFKKLRLAAQKEQMSLPSFYFAFRHTKPNSKLFVKTFKETPFMYQFVADYTK